MDFFHIFSSSQMDRRITSAISGGAGAGLVFPRTPTSTPGQSDGLGALDPPNDPTSKSWTGGVREGRERGAREGTPPLSPCSRDTTNTRTAPPAPPPPQTPRRRASSWGNPSLCPPSSENNPPKRSIVGERRGGRERGGRFRGGGG